MLKLSVKSSFLFSALLVLFIRPSLQLYCYKYECCQENYWILRDIEKLEKDLNSNLCGQTPAKQKLVKVLNFHWKDKNPSKPLVLSFHGSTGTGKTYTAQLIRDASFYEKEKTQYFHFISVSHMFPFQDNENDLREHRNKLRKMVEDAVYYCKFAIIVIDEAHLMSVKLLETLRPFLDDVESVNGVDYRSATFIFISNTGFEGLVDLAHDYYEKGLEQHDIPNKEVEKVLNALAFADKSTAFYKNVILSQHLIDYYVPFFPMTQGHVKCCVTREFKRLKKQTPTESIMTSILKEILFFPSYDPVFAERGCKGVKPAIALNDID